VQERGPSAYIAEFVGTFALVFFITTAASLFVVAPTAQNPAPFIDFTAIGLVHTFALFILIQALAVASGAHFNPAVTVAMTALRQISIPDAGIYIVTQLAGGVAGALVTRLLLSNFPGAETVNYGAPGIGERLDGAVGLGMLGEGIGTFFLVFVIVGVAVNPRGSREWAALAIGAAIGPLTGGSFNPARAFGPSLVSGEFGSAGDFLLAYVLAPVIGAVLAAVVYFNLYVAPGKKGEGGLGPVG
jgi:MIP family channel proteins